MNEKKAVYNGYEERYLTGLELKELFVGQYLATGRHHSVVLGISISEYLYFLNIDDTISYRVFINEYFCRLMDGTTDRLISFFGYHSVKHIRLSNNPEDIHLERVCPQCGAPMEFKNGRYGEFLGCSHYPACRHTMKIPVLGNS
jgi:hypothetical protein